MSSVEHQQIRYAAETIYQHIQPPQYTYGRQSSCKPLNGISIFIIDIFAYIGSWLIIEICILSSPISSPTGHIKLNHTRLYSRLQARWKDVCGASIFLFVRRFRFIFHFSAVAHLHNGEKQDWVQFVWEKDPLKFISIFRWPVIQ